ncbi:MAG: DUF4215 domain-containing protein [Spirochaetia bacterium]|nr:DUF4215 domain-containing protein [Spirochaetia bacterium]
MRLLKNILILSLAGIFFFCLSEAERINEFDSQNENATCGDGNIQPGEECDAGGYQTIDCEINCLAPVCGDGYTNVLAGEECDSAGSQTQACEANCLAPACGDGVRNALAGEACDDGNIINNDGCSSSCQNEQCGDGIRQGTEECDDGVNNNDNVANACRTNCLLPSCGDGVTDTGEACDSGGTDTAACNAGTCESHSCGDGYVNAAAGEECDDTNAVETDACLSTCKTATCGDGYIHGGVEECDDANSVETDVCLSTCKAATCGDGYTQAGVEECDDANAIETDDCLSTCVTAACGDGYIQAGVEECDTGGTDSSTCNSGTCKFSSCGDAYTNTADGEECDNGIFNSDLWADACRTTCLAASCGDGVTDTGEACDTSGADIASCDGFNCTTVVCGDGYWNQTAEVCDTASNTSYCDAGYCRTPSCGDGYLNTAAGETCDDGNLVSGDLCSATCQNEDLNEPNNTIVAATAITPIHSLVESDDPFFFVTPQGTFTIDPVGDVDYYSVYLHKGLNFQAYTTGCSFDSYIEFFDTDGTTLLLSNDNVNTMGFGFPPPLIPVDYCALLNSISGGLGFYPPFDPSVGEYIVPESGTYYLKAGAISGGDPSYTYPLLLTVSDPNEVVRYGVPLGCTFCIYSAIRNNDRFEAKEIQVNDTSYALISEAGDVDYYSIYLLGGRSVTFTTDGCIMDTELTFYDIGGYTELAYNNDISPGTNLCSELTVAIPVSGIYQLKVSEPSGAGGAEYYYPLTSQYDIVFYEGFETDLSAWDTIYYDPAYYSFFDITSSNSAVGASSFMATALQNTGFFQKDIIPTKPLSYVSYYVNITDISVGEHYLWITEPAQMIIVKNGGLYKSASLLGGVVSSNTWHKVEIYNKYAHDGTCTGEAYLDGAFISTLSCLVDASFFRFLQYGNTTYYIDEIEIR